MSNKADKMERVIRESIKPRMADLCSWHIDFLGQTLQTCSYGLNVVWILASNKSSVSAFSHYQLLRYFPVALSFPPVHGRDPSVDCDLAVSVFPGLPCSPSLQATSVEVSEEWKKQSCIQEKEATAKRQKKVSLVRASTCWWIGARTCVN